MKWLLNLFVFDCVLVNVFKLIIEPHQLKHKIRKPESLKTIDSLIRYWLNTTTKRGARLRFINKKISELGLLYN
jgi:hypothetical protein